MCLALTVKKHCSYLVYCPLLLAILLLPESASAAKDSAGESIENFEKQLLETQDRLKKLDQEISESRKLKAKLLKSLDVVNEKVSEREKRINNLNADIAKYNQQLDSLEDAIDQERQHVDERKQLLAKSLRNTQSVTASSGLKVVMQHDSPALADRINVYTDYFMRAQHTAIQQQIAILNKIEQSHQEALKNRNWLNYIKRKATKQHINYTEKLKESKQSIGKVDAKISKKTSTVAELKADHSRLQTLMDELKAAQATRSGYFQAGQGDYTLPVVGKITAHFGDVKSVGKIKWNGLFITAKTGTPVRAIADGEVVYSDWLQGFGDLIILDHGDNYMTLYGGIRDFAVLKDDWVDSGATIATVGDSSGQKDSGLYFEVRHNAKPEDPEVWISNKKGVKSASK